MSITLDQVTKRYQGLPVVNDVSVEVGEGEFFVLLGPSGSGKSTLLRAIAGLTGVDHGRISLHGSDVTHVSARAARRRLRVPELRAVPPHDAWPTTSSSRCACGACGRQIGGSAAKSCSGSSRSKAWTIACPRSSPAASSSASRVARALAHKPRGAAARRAVRRARREDPRRAAAHDPPGAARAGDHYRARHARSGRGVRAGRPHRRDESRPPARDAASPTSCTTGPRRASSRPSSAPRTCCSRKQTEQGIRFGATPVNARRIEKLEGGREHEVVAVLRPEEIELAPTRDNLRTQLHRDRRRGRAGVHRCARAHSRAHDQRSLRCARSAPARMRDGHAPAPFSTSRARSTSSAPSRSCSGNRSRSACDVFTCCRLRFRATRSCAAESAAVERLSQHPFLVELAGRMKTRIAKRIDPMLANLPGQRADAHLRRRRDRLAREGREADRVAAVEWRRRSDGAAVAGSLAAARADSLGR